MNVLVIAEDPIKDQFILKPIIGALLEYLGKPRARVVVHQERLEGFGQALRKERIAQIVLEHRHNVDLFIECVDRDCQYEGNPNAKQHRRKVLDHIEQHIQQQFPNSKFVAENAIEEIEVWVLAGVDWKSGFPEWDWRSIRSECNPKQTYYDKLARQMGLYDEPGNGRQILGAEAAESYAKRLRVLCVEDLQAMEKRIELLVR